MKNEALANEIERDIRLLEHERDCWEDGTPQQAALDRAIAALRANAAPQGGRDHDFAHILQLCSDTDEADPKKLLQEIAAIANKHPWPIPASSPAAGHAEGGGDWAMVPREPDWYELKKIYDDALNKAWRGILDQYGENETGYSAAATSPQPHLIGLQAVYRAAAPKGDKRQC